jgi:hypothetical protein
VLFRSPPLAAGGLLRDLSPSSRRYRHFPSRQL